MPAFQGQRFSPGGQSSVKAPPSPVVAVQEVVDEIEKSQDALPETPRKSGFSGKSLVEKARHDTADYRERAKVRKKLNTFQQIITPIYAYNEEAGGMFTDNGTPTDLALNLLNSHENAVALASAKLGYAPNEINGYLNGPVMRVLINELKNHGKNKELDEEKVAGQVAGMLDALPCTPDQYFAPIDPRVSKRLIEVRHKLSLLDNLEECTQKLGAFSARVLGEYSLEDTANEIYQHVGKLASKDAKKLCDEIGIPADANDRDIAETSLLKSYVKTMAIPAIWITVQEELIPELRQIKSSNDTKRYQELLKKLNEADKSFLLQRVEAIVEKKAPTYSISDQEGDDKETGITQKP